MGKKKTVKAKPAAAPGFRVVEGREYKVTFANGTKSFWRGSGAMERKLLLAGAHVVSVEAVTG